MDLECFGRRKNYFWNQMNWKLFTERNLERIIELTSQGLEIVDILLIEAS